VNIAQHFEAITKSLKQNLLCFVPEANQWWHHADGKWVPAQDFADRLVQDYALEHFPDRLPGRFVREALSYAGAEESLRKSIEHFDSADGYVNTPSGGIRLSDCSQLNPEHPWPFTMSLAATPAIYGEGSDWGLFLEQAVPDAETRRWLQLWAGSLLSGSTEHHALVFIYGPGGTGKSVFAEVLRYALGDYACVLPPEALMGQRGADGAYYRATLKGKRLAIVNETGEGDYWNAPQVKSLTGGDTVLARNPYGRPFSFQPTHKLLVVSNDPPHLSKVDEAWRRRMVVIPFLTKPSRVDPGLKARLEASASEVVGWAVRGWMDLQATESRNLLAERPEAILEATDAYLEEVDTVGEWLEECTEPDSTSSCTPRAVHASFRAYCESMGKKAKSWPNLRHDLSGRGYVSRKTNGMRLVFGLRVTPSVPGWE
jgi:putative DNA primase/helicase